jgi:hypothetical protein
MAGVLALGLLAGCAEAPKYAATQITFPSADETARAFLAAVASGEDVASDPRAGPQFAAGATPARLRAVRALIPKAAPTRVDAVGWRMSGRSDDGLIAELSYAWSYPHQKLLMRAVLHREHDAERWVVTGVEARRTGKTRGLASIGDTAAPKT